jgi:hypothetical protein
MTIEVTTLAPRGEHLLDERLKDETLSSLMEPTWLITPEGQGMISGPENVMEENLSDYITARENEANQLNNLYMFMLESANKMGESLPGYLNRHHKNEMAQENYDRFMKKYERDRFNLETFGEEPSIADFMDPVLLEEMRKQESILDQIETDSLRGIRSDEYARLANGGSPEQELVNQRIAELMMEEPVNEMRAVTPDMFERQKLGIERLLSNLYEPRRARDIAETVSTGIEFTPLGDPAALAEGFQMMGDDQPLMGAALMAGSIFTNMPANKLKGLLKKADEKLDNLRTRQYQAQSKMKGGLSKADFDEGFKESNKIQAEINKATKEKMRIESALDQMDVNTRYLSDHPTAKKPKLTDKMGRAISPRAAVEQMKGKLSGSKSILPEKEALERSDRFLNIKSDGRSFGSHKKGESTSWFIDPETNEVFKWYSGEGATPRGYHVRREVPDFVRKLQESSRKKLSAVPESGTKEPDFFQGLAEKNPSFKKMLVEGRKDEGFIKAVKDESGIINATPEINRLFREISESPSRINTPQHQAAAKLTGEQLRKINQGIEKLEPTERDRVAELIQKLLEDR